MDKKDNKVDKVEKVVEKLKKDDVKAEVISKPAPKVASKSCGHGNTGFCKFCGPL